MRYKGGSMEGAVLVTAVVPLKVQKQILTVH